MSDKTPVFTSVLIQIDGKDITLQVSEAVPSNCAKFHLNNELIAIQMDDTIYGPSDDADTITYSAADYPGGVDQLVERLQAAMNDPSVIEAIKSEQ